MANVGTEVEKAPLTRAERIARMERERIEGLENMARLRAEQAAFQANYERLKAERKAREAMPGSLSCRVGGGAFRSSRDQGDRIFERARS